MAGIYIHIPFCKKACHYCDFHFSTSLQYKNEVLAALLKEIELQQDYLQGEEIESIYFGGGTPSILSQAELESLLQKVHQHFKVNAKLECTLEANPDDLSIRKIKDLHEIGINRLSIGIQSFFDDDLIYMNRSHNALQAQHVIDMSMQGGIENISIDLIFGYPLLTDDKWQHNIEIALQNKVAHLSCYAMTVEPKTALASFIKTNKVPPIDQAQSAAQFELLMNKLQANHYEHYEISNYALKGKRAVHNSNYWKGVSYLGIGPSAHSFNQNSRQWNVANNAKYIASLLENKISFEIETLSEEQKLNELILISLRTIEGLDSSIIADKLDRTRFEKWHQMVDGFIQKGLVAISEKHILLTQKGKLFADHIAAELFI